MAEVLADLVGRLSFDADDRGVKKFAHGVDSLAKASDAATTKGVALGTFMGNLSTKALDLAAAMGKAAAVAAKDLVVGFAETGVELDRTAKRVDLSVVALQRWEAVARKAGVAPEAAAKGLDVFNKNLSELALKGSGPAKDALGLLGLEFSELEGLGTEERLGVIADALAAVPDAGDRAALTMQLFGEEAAKLSPILAQGRAGLDAIGDAAEEAGLVLDEKAVESAKRTAKALGDIDKTTTAVGNTIAVALAPVVADLAERFGEWYRANEDVIAQRVPEVVDAIVEGVTELVDWGQQLAHGVENLTGLFVDLGEEGGGALGSLTDVLSTLVGWSKAGIETFVEWTDDVAALADVVWDVGGAIKDGLVTAYEAAEGVIDRVSDAIMEQLGFLDPVVEVIEGIVERLSNARALVTDIAEEVGLSRAFSPEDLTAIGDAKASATAPARQQIDDARAERDYQNRQRDYREKLFDDANKADLARAGSDVRKLRALLDASRDPEFRAEVERKIKAAKYGANLRAGKGSKAVDTTEAESAFGTEFGALARAAGVGDQAVKAALEASAKSLAGGASKTVARQAGVGQLESLSGADLSHAGGVDAAMFGLLTNIGGPQAARSAADGARFVQVTNTWNFTNHFEMQLPPGFGDGLRSDVEGVAGSIEQRLTPIWEAVLDRLGGGLEP